MSGQSVNTVIGGDWPNPLPNTKYGPPTEKPKGLDWSKHRAPEPQPTPQTKQPEATVAEIRQRIQKPAQPKRYCQCSTQISANATRCRTCAARHNSATRKTYTTRTSIVDIPTARTEYLDGSTCPEIAARHNWPVVSVRRQLARAGVPMRDDRTTHSGGGNIRIYDPQLASKIRILYLDQGLSQAKTAQQLGTTLKVVRNIMHRDGVPARQGQAGGGDTLQGYRDRLDELGITAFDVRTWALTKRLQVSDRGVVAGHIIDAYEQAHEL